TLTEGVFFSSACYLISICFSSFSLHFPFPMLLSNLVHIISFLAVLHSYYLSIFVLYFS
ncbi:hypothetical protein HOY80DRAFT_966216, partial [Tuber brumale]